MPTLYSFSESGNSYKVRLLASILHIPLKVVELDFIGDEQHSSSFLSINPRGEVPTLVLDDANKTALTDSAAILTYLAGSSPSSGYWSTDILEQAQIVDWLAFSASWVQYGVFTARAIVSFQGPYNGLGTRTGVGALEEAQKRGHTSLKILDGRLEKRDWLTLDRPTIADIAVFVYVALAPMGDVSLEEYRNVRAWIERVKNLEGFIPILGLDDPEYRKRAAKGE